MSEYKILTPDFRTKINNSINRGIRELAECKSNAYTNIQKIALSSLKTVINALPDGYLLPVERRK